jgi:hypothetical protein
MMDSAFLTLQLTLEGSLFLFAFVLFIKLIVQYGGPTRPLKTLSYLTSASVVLFLGFNFFMSLGLVEYSLWLKARPILLATAASGIFIEAVLITEDFPNRQEKFIAKIPLLIGFLIFTAFPQYVEFLSTLLVLGGGWVLYRSPGRLRYQKRIFVKLLIFLALSALTSWFGFFVLFYFFLFQQTFGLMSLLERTTEGRTL